MLPWQDFDGQTIEVKANEEHNDTHEHENIRFVSGIAFARRRSDCSPDEQAYHQQVHQYEEQKDGTRQQTCDESENEA